MPRTVTVDLDDLRLILNAGAGDLHERGEVDALDAFLRLDRAAEAALAPGPPLSLDALRGRYVALDFDGVLHSYTSGWTGYTPADPPVPGALVFVDTLINAGARPVVLTSRADSPEGLAATERYLAEHGFPALPVTCEKIGAVAYVDDRAVPFRQDAGTSWEQVLADVVRLARGSDRPPAPVDPQPPRDDR